MTTEHRCLRCDAVIKEPKVKKKRGVKIYSSHLCPKCLDRNSKSSFSGEYTVHLRGTI